MWLAAEPDASASRSAVSAARGVGDARPIGVFDSGVGGLTVARALIDLLPDERIIYLGDTARGPYGPRPLGEVRQFTAGIMAWLHRQDVKLTVAACNTATAAALEVDPLPVPVPTIGVIEPAVRVAVAATRSGRVGVIGTEATIGSGAYARAVVRAAPNLELYSRACPEFVTYVEQGRTTDPQVLEAVGAALQPLRRAQVDTLILGCTHYPLLTGAISHVMGADVVLVSSAEATARAVFSHLVATGTLSQTAGPNRYVATGDGQVFTALASRFLGPRIPQVELEDIAPVGAGRS
jgi:glutamate racemase